MGYRRIILLFITFLSLMPCFGANSEPPSEYREIDLRIVPAMDLFMASPSSYKNAFSIGGHVSYFLKPSFGIDMFYQFSQYDPTDLHRAGAGPIFKILDLRYMRFEVSANAAYMRILGYNRVSWGATGFLSYPFKKASFSPFIGPVVSYQYSHVPGDNLKTLTLGLQLSLTGKADLI
ncbi:MAG: hypothetical protein KDD48_07755 [Bdellovibrionales bacterium]|nr:hypothetical protein [Bdellovibrionales bacterium]